MTKRTRKLTLNKETVKNLTNGELGAVQGGAMGTIFSCKSICWEAMKLAAGQIVYYGGARYRVLAMGLYDKL